MILTPTAHVDNVDVVRSQRYLLRGIDFRVQPGEHWVVLGPNGAGKSTLLGLLGSTLLGLLGARTHPTRGSVHVLGRQLGRIDMRELRTLIGHVDPRHQANSPLTATEVVWTGLTNTTHLVRREAPSGEELRHANELLAIVGMGDRRELLWATMSQGERGRVLIARALITRPRLLLLDEPSTGLDVGAREELLSLLDDFRVDIPELATLMVTHHFEEIPANTSHALLIRDGEIIAAGPIDPVLTSTTVSECFSHSLAVEKSTGRWIARSRPVSPMPL